MMRTLLIYLRRQADLEYNRWILWLPVLFACGIGIYFALPFEPSKWLTLGIIECLIIVSIIFKHHLKILKIIGLISIMVFGFCWIQLRTIYIASKIYDVPKDKTYISGQINKIDYNQNGKLRLTLDKIKNFDDNPINGSFRITLRQKNHSFKVGQCVEMVAQLMPPPQTQIASGYQFDRGYFYKGLSGHGYSLSQVYEIECNTESDLYTYFSNAIYNWRKSIIKHISTVLTGDTAAIVAAIVAGEQGGINKKLFENYRNSGLAHFLSISGLHMSLIAGLMFFLVRLFMALIPCLSLRFDSKKFAVGFAIIISAIYLVISGAGIPVQRAFIMTIIVLLGVLFNRKAVSMISIAWASFLVLLITPEALISASFQMSFAAVVALIAFYEKIATKLSHWIQNKKDSIFNKTIKSILIYIFGIIIADLIASLATLPFAIYHFNRIAVYTTLANLLAGPIIGLLIMPFTLFALLLMPFNIDISCLKIVGLGVELVNKITSRIGDMEGASLQIVSMPFWGLMFIVLGGLWLCIWERKWRWWGSILIVIGFLSIMQTTKPDVLISTNNEVIAIKDKQNNMVILPSRGNKFTKQLWLEKTASKQISSSKKKQLAKLLARKITKIDWLDLKCDNDVCVYKKQITITPDKIISINNIPIIANDETYAIYLHPTLKIENIRNYVGYRLWNKKDDDDK